MDILLVEDNPSDAELTLLALKKAVPELTVIHAQDGAEAQIILEQQEREFATGNASALPKLILLDLKLPKIDGFEVLRAVKRRATYQCVPVVMFTSSREERDVIQAYALGANSYTVKPVNFNELKDALALIAAYWLQRNIRPLWADGYQGSRAS